MDVHALIQATQEADLEAAEEAWKEDQRKRAALDQEHRLAGKNPGLTVNELLAKMYGEEVQAPAIEAPKPVPEEVPPEPEVKDHESKLPPFPAPPLGGR